ncbi:MAG TPA: hypothetical protein VGE52_11730, partial [Pirellulales bacterium]
MSQFDPSESSANPYQAPTTPAFASPAENATAPLPADLAKIVRNIRAICVLYLILGSIVALAGAGGLFVEPPAGADREGIPKPFAAVMLILGLGGAISAFGVLTRRSWGVPFCQVISACYLLSFPVGTILGGYFLW